MRVFNNQAQGSHTLYVAPAGDPRVASTDVDADWLNEDGTPKMFGVHFKDGGATVPDSVGRYLCSTKQAKRTRLIIPGLV